jgi:hypothetical protein
MITEEKRALFEGKMRQIATAYFRGAQDAAMVLATFLPPETIFNEQVADGALRFIHAPTNTLLATVDVRGVVTEDGEDIRLEVVMLFELGKEELERLSADTLGSAEPTIH